MAARALLTVTLTLGGCAREAGGGRFGRLYFDFARTLVVELEVHHKAAGAYPQTLAALPSFTEIPERHRGAFEYTPANHGYVLRFFHGPGINVCEYEPPRGNWMCSGAR